MAALRAARTMMFGTALAMGAGSAFAQFGGIFDPPRPPGSVPTRQAPQAPPQAPPQLAPPQPAPTLLPPGPAQGRIQSEDLPPPGIAPGLPAALPRPGAAAVPPLQQQPGAPQPGQLQPGSQPAQQPGQRLPQRAGVPPANIPPGPPSPPEDVVTQPPPNRVTNPTAVFSGLDKITGRITAFDAAIGETVQFGALQVTARACYSRPPTESALTDGFVEVDEVTLQGEVRRIFTGWMFAASPGLHGVEHPIYDVWLTDCKGGQQAVADAQPPAPARPAAAPPPGQRQTAPPQPRQPRTNPPGTTLTQPGQFR
jgi:hypothetical protein